MRSLGKHFLAVLFGCNTEIINNVELVEEHMKTSATLSGATIVQSVFHTFSPYGVSGVVIVAESHLAVHTWPEHDYVAVDFFSCGNFIFRVIHTFKKKKKFSSFIIIFNRVL